MFYFFVYFFFCCLPLCVASQYKALKKHRIPLGLQEKSKKISIKIIEEQIPYNTTYQALSKYLEKIKVLQKKKIFTGYTIQVYMGNEKKKAITQKNILHQLLPTQKAITIFYEQPNYYVQIGHFLTTIEMQPMYQKIKKCIPQAIIRPKKIPLHIPLTYYSKNNIPQNVVSP